MKINHEAPRCLLPLSQQFNNYDFVLPHLLDSDGEYMQHFMEARRKKRYLIMDNSLHELGYAYDSRRLLYWIKRLEPDEFVVPDVWEDFHQTCAQAKHWKQFTYPSNTTLVAVVQAKHYGQAYECYNILKILGYKKIAFSYGADYYNDISNHPNKDLGKALGRIEIISKLYKEGLIEDNDRVHLLGCAVPQEFGWYKDFPFIESIDTSNPVMAALEGEKYTEQGLQSKPKANMNDHFDITIDNVNLELLEHNIKTFRKINGFSPYPIEHTGTL
tara:strand:+ start:560 stop:1378 length:819 start_codon:yes stop_codon:yes gene_type:complete